MTSRKSFGKFVCAPCQTAWSSAHAFNAPEFQRCKACKAELPAKWRWQTTVASPRASRDEDAAEERKPHQEALCSVCVRLGYPCWYDPRD